MRNHDGYAHTRSAVRCFPLLGRITSIASMNFNWRITYDTDDQAVHLRDCTDEGPIYRINTN
jgi:hypothetical protein